MGIVCEIYDLEKEGPKQLWNLYREVYGSEDTLLRRWHWEIGQHPLRHRIRIIVARDGRRLVGQSVRLPVDLVVGGGHVPAEFAVNSMVHPDYRGRGVIRDIYRFGFEAGILQLSKGTAPAMYRLLMKMGYFKIKPDTMMTALLRPFSWGASKLLKKTVRLPLFKSPEQIVDDTGFSPVREFSSDWRMPQPLVRAFCRKTPAFLNWRYLEIPHRCYACYGLEKSGHLMAWYVIHLRGSTAYLVDLGWEGEFSSVAGPLIRSAKIQAMRQGCIKIVFWGNGVALRRELSRSGFRPISESPGFSCYGTDRDWSSFPWQETHFVHGDGDIDYL